MALLVPNRVQQLYDQLGKRQTSTSHYKYEGSRHELHSHSVPYKTLIVVTSNDSKALITSLIDSIASWAVNIISWCSVFNCLATLLAAKMSGLSWLIPIEKV
ncbi:hypothetical protein BpHYR1_019251 [Brachionus plicatilis]|uniref:Uncharacterized protein n=1 Tax=Brachionus plicatilis TaxID=10195 RepID=A0A3M7PEH9_BRAPC|nr:hypothetical protein BpHYR1_019251 [Brachionus plicatilis]